MEIKDYIANRILVRSTFTKLKKRSKTLISQAIATTKNNKKTIKSKYMYDKSTNDTKKKLYIPFALHLIANYSVTFSLLSLWIHLLTSASLLFLHEMSFFVSQPHFCLTLFRVFVIWCSLRDFQGWLFILRNRKASRNMSVAGDKKWQRKKCQIEAK